MNLYSGGAYGEVEVTWEWQDARETAQEILDSADLFEEGTARIVVQPDPPHPWDEPRHKLLVGGRPKSR